jgi:hypothetical protein
MRLLEGMIHFLNEAIEEFIGSEEHQIGEKPDTGESQLLTLATLTAGTRKALWSWGC